MQVVHAALGAAFLFLAGCVPLERWAQAQQHDGPIVQVQMLRLPAACLPREAMAEHLSAAFGERIVAQGITAGGRLLQLWSAADGATWSAVIVSGATACMAADGDSFELFSGRDL